MRRILSIAILCAILICSTGCSSSEQSPKQSETPQLENFDQFIDRYKREDISVLTESAEMVIKDLLSIVGKQSGTLDDWVKNERFSIDPIEWYDFDGVLFSQPAEMTAIIRGDKTSSFSINLEMNSADENFSIAMQLSEYMFAAYGDATSIQIGDEDSTEHNLRDIFSRKDVSIKFSCTWEFDVNGKTNDISVSYSYMNIVDIVYSSFYLSAYAEV